MLRRIFKKITPKEKQFKPSIERASRSSSPKQHPWAHYPGRPATRIPSSVLPQSAAQTQMIKDAADKFEKMRAERIPLAKPRIENAASRSSSSKQHPWAHAPRPATRIPSPVSPQRAAQTKMIKDAADRYAADKEGMKSKKGGKK